MITAPSEVTFRNERNLKLYFLIVGWRFIMLANEL